MIFGVMVTRCPGPSDAVCGAIVTTTVWGGETGFDTGFNVSEADAVLVGSAWLVAVTMMICWEATLAGAE